MAESGFGYEKGDPLLEAHNRAVSAWRRVNARAKQRNSNENHYDKNKHPERGPHKVETSFIVLSRSGMRVFKSSSIKIEVANRTLMEKYPEYGKDGKFLVLEVSEKGEGVVVKPNGGKTPLFKNRYENSRTKKGGI